MVLLLLFIKDPSVPSGPGVPVIPTRTQRGYGWVSRGQSLSGLGEKGHRWSPFPEETDGPTHATPGA